MDRTLLVMKIKKYILSLIWRILKKEMMQNRFFITGRSFTQEDFFEFGDYRFYQNRCYNYKYFYDEIGRLYKIEKIKLNKYKK
jgi:hypothetical protein